MSQRKRFGKPCDSLPSSASCIMYPRRRSLLTLRKLFPWWNWQIRFLEISLSVEEQKWVTIGVELPAKQELLLFLDESTYGPGSDRRDRARSSGVHRGCVPDVDVARVLEGSDHGRWGAFSLWRCIGREGGTLENGVMRKEELGS